MDTLENAFDFSNAKPGTILEVETKNSIYQIKVIKGRKVEITGGMLRNGEDRFPTATPTAILGSLDKQRGVPNHIVHGMCLALTEIIDEHRIGITTTSPVQNLKVEDPDGIWIYDMEWNA